MIRVAHIAGAAALLAIVLIVYGVKEETRAVKAEIDALAAARTLVAGEIASLKIEERYLSSPERLRAVAAALYGRDGMIDAEGAPLAPWRPDQAARLAIRRADR